MASAPKPAITTIKPCPSTSTQSVDPVPCNSGIQKPRLNLPVHHLKHPQAVAVAPLPTPPKISPGVDTLLVRKLPMLPSISIAVAAKQTTGQREIQRREREDEREEKENCRTEIEKEKNQRRPTAQPSHDGDPICSSAVDSHHPRALPRAQASTHHLGRLTSSSPPPSANLPIRRMPNRRRTVPLPRRL